MDFDLIIVFLLLIIAPFLFAWRRISFGLAALVIMSILMISGILSPREGLSGFGNSATITIASMFVISQGIRRTGGLDYISRFFSAFGKAKKAFGIFAIMLIVAVISAFINNTAAVAIFIPVIIGVSKDLDTSPSKLLIPLSFASMFGGVCTLIGTSTNVLVSSIAKSNGLAGFSMFEFAPLGIILLAVGFIYLFTVGLKLVPNRRKGEGLTEDFSMHEYITELEIEEDFEGIGEPLDETCLIGNLDLDILDVFPEQEEKSVNKKDWHIHEGDILRIRGGAKDIGKLILREGLKIRPGRKINEIELEEGDFSVVEIVIAPDSPIESRTIEDVDFMEKYGAIVLALRSRGELKQENLNEISLRGGDSLLLYINSNRIENLKSDNSLVMVSEIGLKKYRKKKLPLALGILAAIVLSVAFGILPIVVAAISGGILLVLTGCLNSDDALSSINWKVIFLLAGVIPLGIAMEKTGAANLISDLMVSNLENLGPHAILAGIFLLSMVLTNIISNQATATILAPIAISTANNTNVNPRAFLLAITFAASLSFMTPVGYQTNTLIYGPGNYRFTDFLKVGLPLNIILWIIASLMIPIFWPL
ncbi:MAG: SLC13 family permease [Candidatus Zixiibacteriota bacterium]